MNGKGKADPIDASIGVRLRARRLEVGLNQTDLAKELGVTFQQVQKYEKGVNRISGSMIARACKALAVEPNYFFDRLDQQPEPGLESAMSRGGFELVRLFGGMDPTRQKSLLNVARAMMPDELAAA